MATIADVAARARVSAATVSRVLNGAASVDPAMAERVRAASDELRYRPSHVARMLAGVRSRIIGVLVPDIQNPFFMEIVRGVETVARNHNYLVVLCSFMEDPRLERQYMGVLAVEPIAGVLLVPTRERHPALRAFHDRGIPVVAVDQRVQDDAIDTVMIDNAGAAREATAHLIATGHRRIALITGPENTTTGRERRAGYRQALHEAGIPHDPEIDRSGKYAEETGQRLTHELLDLARPIDAIVTGNNRVTMGALRAFHARGRRIPEDVALVGFDELPWVVPGSVSLTTIIQPAFELGSAGTLRLVQRLQAKQVLARQETVLAHSLRIGDSSRRLSVPAGSRAEEQRPLGPASARS